MERIGELEFPLPLIVDCGKELPSRGQASGGEIDYYGWRVVLETNIKEGAEMRG